MLTRLVQFHENMISALTWLTSAESKIAELDSAVDAAATEEHPDVDSLKSDLQVKDFFYIMVTNYVMLYLFIIFIVLFFVYLYFLHPSFLPSFPSLLLPFSPSLLLS